MTSPIDWPRSRGFLEQLELHEGKVLMPYHDTVGKLTIGVGRNLDDVGISDDEANYLLSNDVRRSARLLDQGISWWRNLDPARQRVLLDMCFNMGWAPGTRGGLDDFKATLSAVHAGDFVTAANHMGDSKWARQVGARAHRLMDMMRTGQLPGSLR